MADPGATDYDVVEFKQAGFRGGINYYRNFRSGTGRLRRSLPTLNGASAILAGDKDVVIRGAATCGRAYSFDEECSARFWSQ